MERQRLPLKLQLKAQQDIRNIAQVHESLVGVISARRITDQIYQALERLQQFPLSGSRVPDERMRAAGYRYIVVKKYIVIYQVLEDMIRVDRIVHGASNYPKLFRGRTLYD